MIETARQVAAILLEVEAVKLSPEKPFQWSSGWNSPIYCDNRVSLSYPSERSVIRDSLVQLIVERFPEADYIAGVATAGIPQGALIADQLEKPFIYVRSKPKGHGMQNLIEGKSEAGKKCVVVEDLISTGGSSLKAVEALREAGMEVEGLVAIFTYGFDLASRNFMEAGVTFNALSDYETLLEVALEKEYITENDMEILMTWREAPEVWGK